MNKMRFYILTMACMAGLQSCAQVSTSSQPALPAQWPQQDIRFELERIIPGTFNFMDVDVLNNLYLVTAGNQLKKLNANGDSVAVFNDVKKYGNPSLIDVTNPLKVLLYYKNFSTVVILDRFLSQRNSINFRKQNIFSVKAVGTSYDNHIWLFDEQDMNLKKIDDEGQLLQESTDWRQIMNEVPTPTSIIDHNQFVYLYDPQKGFYIFDYYGTYKNNLPFLQWENISVGTSHISGFTGNQFQRYELQKLNLKTYTLPATFAGYTAIKAMNGKIYLLKKDAVEIYAVQ
ncbi:MAG: hypothetical protein EOO03_05640 [Chitinophagaceae bacterium]|nr:MAG: hypothetical protein EOO03_05640 [Chitinophagaceae bacterium]